MANGFSCEVDFTYGTDGNHMAQTSSQKQNQPIPVFYLIYTLTQLHTKILLLVWYQNKTHEMMTPLLLPVKVYSENNYIAFNLMQQAESFMIW